MRRGPHPRCAVVLLGLWGMATAAEAQQDSAVVVAREHYATPSLPERFLGRDYRDVWTTPVRVPVPKPPF